ncbi:MAG: helix-turn-helix domain-containing protein [Pseudomonadota bacterium]|uniref:Transcriptional regulator, IclR family n=1 Tax=hydrothermal vent metagenome TaxID=652676 RepID=A0A160TLQ8_9ZZZZ
MTVADDRADRMAASKTLQRGLDLIEAVARGEGHPVNLADATGLTYSTTHRIAGVLVERGYLVPIRRGGYRLGPTAAHIGFEAQRQLDLIQVARPHLEAVAAATRDTASLAVLREDGVLHLDVVLGTRPTIVARRLGERQPFDSAIGKVLRGAEFAAGEEEGGQIYCAAAPVRGFARSVVAALALSSPARDSDEARAEALARAVTGAAEALSHDLGSVAR